MSEAISPAVSPLRGHSEARVPAGDAAVTLTERKLVSLVQVAAWPETAEQVEGILASLIGCAPPQGPAGSSGDAGGAILALSPGRWLVESGDPRLAARLGEQIPPALGAVADLSHARIAIRVSGPKAAWVLAKGLALDLHPQAFPPMKVAQSAVHEVGVVVRRLSADKLGGDSFDLYVYRGFALSFWDWLTEAAAETGYRVDPPGSA
ncbi:sarcosine oxidase subunit gamma [Pelagibius marinus]|uniref:sarcosine oxidase subunit gamma n=1 Tax=Pelagibius marinus TaxID=2762760 RepID=UPI0018722DB3|nr:sarcosine oxidase subunit gamma family protein [Pelagibius marinus]